MKYNVIRCFFRHLNENGLSTIWSKLCKVPVRLNELGMTVVDFVLISKKYLSFSRSLINIEPGFVTTNVLYFGNIGTGWLPDTGWRESACKATSYQCWLVVLFDEPGATCVPMCSLSGNSLIYFIAFCSLHSLFWKILIRSMVT